MDNDIVVHEMTHGITNRMTGGGTARCLQTIEARGMGEGWSDAMAEYDLYHYLPFVDHRDTPGQVDRADLRGCQGFYSGSICPQQYYWSSELPLLHQPIIQIWDVSDIGEVWANILHNVYAALVQRYGFSTTARTTPGGTEGNIVFLHLFIDALALQPCNPSSEVLELEPLAMWTAKSFHQHVLWNFDKETE
ncbi:hypothetical protein C0995_014780 [Termitomyces sp. Mi166|nr:hypothetical protein C0995_014780 [Termitomyces sp. Mi166\